TISGAMPNPFQVLQQSLERRLQASGITIKNEVVVSSNNQQQVLHSYASPNMDSLVYWFMQKSINLYGEALLKTLAQQKNGIGSTDAGVQWMRKYWQERGIDVNALRMVDGSGLSPLNRNTAYT
ncbi:MAG TPA: D-alanyl-D-alanine carboxypeptidase/D-alanyl-D-alanine-endopeptidase, partial [Chitinophagaceae bacterium]|nr:D-alanyl-D-alanine carboxypeptidase/D-alanyl-D-alanine-endopeptidase [Chitinophagaceae bacterium]